MEYIYVVKEERPEDTYYYYFKKLQTAKQKFNTLKDENVKRGMTIDTKEDRYIVLTEEVECEPDYEVTIQILKEQII